MPARRRRADDALAPTLRPALELLGGDAVPTIIDRVEAFEAWADDNAETGSEPPRSLGAHRSRLRGVEYDHYTSSYTPYMVQRVTDAYRSLGAEERARVDAALAGTGIEALLAFEPRHRVGKRDFKLVFVD